MSDPYYTAFHFQPLKNWMNDPNGPFYDGDTGLYHIFAQYNPNGPTWADMSWYHAVSTDMVHWAHLPVALTPDHSYDCGGEYSGSATLVDGVPVLSLSVACGKWVLMAIPASDKTTDPLMINWKKNGTMPGSGAPFSGPVFDAPAGEGQGTRDPTTGWQGSDKVWRMATGCGDKTSKKGGACLFKSENFANWTAVGWLHHPLGAQNTPFWECPDFFRMPGTDKFVLKASSGSDWWSLGTYTEKPGMTEDEFTPISYDIHEGPCEWHGRSGYNNTLGCQKYDFGHFYASKSFFDSGKNRQILWGWISESGPPNGPNGPHPGEDWASIQSLPRVITIDPANSSRLMFAPIPELETLRGAPVSFSATIKPGEAVAVPSVAGNQLDIEMNITADFTSADVHAGILVFGNQTLTVRKRYCSCVFDRNSTSTVHVHLIETVLFMCIILIETIIWQDTLRTSIRKTQKILVLQGKFPGGVPGIDGFPVTIAGTGPNNTEGIPLLTLDVGGPHRFGPPGNTIIGPSTMVVSLRVILDRSVIEAYSAGGRGVGTHRIYPAAGEDKVSLINMGKVNVTIDLVAFPMAVAEPSTIDQILAQI